MNKQLNLSDDLGDELDKLGYEEVASYFSDKALELELDFPDLMQPLLWAAKGVFGLGELNSVKRFQVDHHLEKWRMSVTWLTHAAGPLREHVAKLNADVEDLRSDLQKEAFKYLRQSGIRVSDEKLSAHMRQNAEFRKKDRQLSVLRAILQTVLDHCDQYRLIKDVLVQESTLVKRIMSH